MVRIQKKSRFREDRDRPRGPIRTPSYFDYKDIETLKKFLTKKGRIKGRVRTGITAKQHRQLKTAIKQARFMALLPYTDGHK